MKKQKNGPSGSFRPWTMGCGASTTIDDVAPPSSAKTVVAAQPLKKEVPGEEFPETRLRIFHINGAQEE